MMWMRICEIEKCNLATMHLGTHCPKHIKFNRYYTIPKPKEEEEE